MLPASKRGKPRAEVQVDEVTGCWNYGGTLDRDGYPGMVSLPGGVRTKAHRAYFIQAGGVIPDGYHLDHLCRNRRCVNPDHMEPITPTENQERRVRGNRRNQQMIRELVTVDRLMTVEEAAESFMLPVHYIEAIIRWPQG